MLVSKAGVTGSADKALFAQLGGYPSALGMSAFLMGSLALLPGVPMLPFLALDGLTGGAAWQLHKRRSKEAVATAEKDGVVAQVPVMEESNSTALQIDTMRSETGYALLPVINNEHGKQLTDQNQVRRR